MSFTAVDGRKVFYQCPHSLVGEGAKGKTVIMIHGVRGNHRIWHPQIDFLAAEHTPVGIDLPGHGQSEGPGSIAVEKYSDFLKEMVGALALTDFVIAGHSLGGSVALDYALRHTGVQALILVGSGANWEIPQEFLQLWRSDPKRAREESNSRAFSKNTPRTIVEQYDRDTAEADPLVVVGDLEAANTWDVAAELDKIKVPTSIICGEEDPQIERSRLLHSRISGSILEIIKDAGHDPTIEQPKITNRLFQSFLDSLA